MVGELFYEGWLKANSANCENRIALAKLCQCHLGLLLLQWAL